MEMLQVEFKEKKYSVRLAQLTFDQWHRLALLIEMANSQPERRTLLARASVGILSPAAVADAEDWTAQECLSFIRAAAPSTQIDAITSSVSSFTRSTNRLLSQLAGERRSHGETSGV
jgi:hypothetical protein